MLKFYDAIELSDKNKTTDSSTNRGRAPKSKRLTRKFPVSLCQSGTGPSCKFHFKTAEVLLF